METVYLVGTHWKRSGSPLKASSESLEELGRLAETAGGTVVGKILQSLDAPSPRTFIGKGKAEELRRLASRGAFRTLIFDDELKPAQQKNLSEIIPAKVLDRTRLILDIFARRARTREGILQIELAQLSYLLPRMTERYGRFEQQVGGIGTRGPGERKLEVEARHIRDRVTHLRRQVDSIKLHREVARERRRNVPLPSAAIVGYTNAGKSTLLNKLTSLYGQTREPIYADDRLFATLDPTTRRIRMPSGRVCLFTDTVGFINKLPHHLIAAFRSTLEESLDADVLVHLIDAADPDFTGHAGTVRETLKSLEDGTDRKTDRILPVFSKADLLSPARKARLESRAAGLFQAGDGDADVSPDDPPILLSAVEGTGIHRLLEAVEERLARRMIETDVFIPFRHSGVLDALYRLGRVEQVSHRRRGVKLRLRLEKSHWGKLQKILHNGGP